MSGATSTSSHNYGTHTSLDTLETLKAVSNMSVLQYGEDRILAAVQAQLAFHNEQLNEVLDLFVERTTDRTRAVGSASMMQMDEIDEIGTPDAQKVRPVSGNLGFPLRKYGISLQWTRTYLENAVPFDIALATTSALDADRINIYKAIKRALFKPTNYTFKDRLVDWYNLPVKALSNGDSFPIPPGPNGEFFDSSTHTHYAGISAATWNSNVSGDITTSAAAVSALILNVFENYQAGNLLMYINAAQELKIRQMTGNFYAYTDSRIIYPDTTPAGTALYARGNLNVQQPYNRPIGIFNQAEVWVKPWIPSGYIYVWNPDAPRPLAYRTRNNVNGDFRMVYEDEVHPLRANVFEREFGLGIQERTNGAVLYVNPGNVDTYAWSDSTI